MPYLERLLNSGLIDSAAPVKFPRSGAMINGVIYKEPCSLITPPCVHKRADWPTLTRHDRKEAPISRLIPGGYGYNLNEAVLLWPTLTRRGYNNARAIRQLPLLCESFEEMASLATGIINNKGRGIDIYSYWEAKKHETIDPEKRQRVRDFVGYGKNRVRHINPVWAEALMGYPRGWTNLAYDDLDQKTSGPDYYFGAWADGSWEAGIERSAVKGPGHVKRLAGLGNAVVPQAPLLIFRSKYFSMYTERPQHYIIG
jgi:hypothetical protein